MLGAQVMQETLHLGSMVSILKLKGIHKALHKWFNSIQHA
jgi:hypothetical protein